MLIEFKAGQSCPSRVSLTWKSPFQMTDIYRDRRYLSVNLTMDLESDRLLKNNSPKICTMLGEIGSYYTEVITKSVYILRTVIT